VAFFTGLRNHLTLFGWLLCNAVRLMISNHLFLGNVQRVLERLHRCLAVAVLPGMGPLLVVLIDPYINVCLSSSTDMDLLSECGRPCERLPPARTVLP